MLLSISLQNINCKDNIRYGQKSDTSILFNLKKQKILPCYRDRWPMAETEAPFTIARRRSLNGDIRLHRKWVGLSYCKEQSYHLPL